MAPSSLVKSLAHNIMPRHSPCIQIFNRLPCSVGLVVVSYPFDLVDHLALNKIVTQDLLYRIFVFRLFVVFGFLRLVFDCFGGYGIGDVDVASV